MARRKNMKTRTNGFRGEGKEKLYRKNYIDFFYTGHIINELNK